MNRDEIRKILGEEASEEKITELLNSFHNSNKEKDNLLKEANDKISNMSDYSSMKAKLEEIERANMTREEQLVLREKQAQENLEKSSIILNTTKAKQILSGYELSERVISKLVSSDEANTITLATELKNSLDLMSENTKKATRESLTNVDLKPSMSNVSQSEEAMTFDKFAKLSAEEQEKFISEHPEEFEKL